MAQRDCDWMKSRDYNAVHDPHGWYTVRLWTGQGVMDLGDSDLGLFFFFGGRVKGLQPIFHTSLYITYHFEGLEGYSQFYQFYTQLPPILQFHCWNKGVEIRYASSRLAGRKNKCTVHARSHQNCIRYELTTSMSIQIPGYRRGYLSQNVLISGNGLRKP
jgi:hypothetical protein